MRSAALAIKHFLRNDHADFVVCNKTDLNAICVIQLPGIATERISEMCQQINLPLLKLKVGVNYSTLELHQALAPLLGLTKTVQECPHCEKSLAIKMARNGQRKGQYFWVCESCKYRRRVR